MRALLAASPAAVLSQDPMGGTIMLTGQMLHFGKPSRCGLVLGIDGY